MDGARGAAMLKRMGIESSVPTSSTMLEDIMVKMLVSDAARRQRAVTKADVNCVL